MFLLFLASQSEFKIKSFFFSIYFDITLSQMDFTSISLIFKFEILSQLPGFWFCYFVGDVNSLLSFTCTSNTRTLTLRYNFGGRIISCLTLSACLGSLIFSSLSLFL